MVKKINDRQFDKQVRAAIIKTILRDQKKYLENKNELNKLIKEQGYPRKHLKEKLKILNNQIERASVVYKLLTR